MTNTETQTQKRFKVVLYERTTRTDGNEKPRTKSFGGTEIQKPPSVELVVVEPYLADIPIA